MAYGSEDVDFKVDNACSIYESSILAVTCMINKKSAVYINRTLTVNIDTSYLFISILSKRLRVMIRHVRLEILISVRHGSSKSPILFQYLRKGKCKCYYYQGHSTLRTMI